MQGIQRVFAVLEAVAQHQPAGVGELSMIFGLPKSTVQRHLWALSDAGWIGPVGEEFTRCRQRSNLKPIRRSKTRPPVRGS